MHLDPEHAEPLPQHLGGLVDELGWYGMGDWKYYGTTSYEAPANWKTVFEGFREAWHAPNVHPATVRGGTDIPRTRYASLAPHSMMLSPLVAKDIDSAPEPVEHRAHADCHYLVFPHAFFNMYPDQGYLNTVYPIDENRTIMQGYVVARREAPAGVEPDAWEASVKSSIRYMERIVSEDFRIASEISAVKHSFGYRGNLYSTLECRITEFHREMAKRLG